MAHKVSVLSIVLFSAIMLVRADETAPSLTEEALSTSINEFGCNLLNGLYKDTPVEENILVSPVNAYAALALLRLGAGEKTRNELSGVMKLPENEMWYDVCRGIGAAAWCLQRPDLVAFFEGEGLMKNRYRGRTVSSTGVHEQLSAILTLLSPAKENQHHQRGTYHETKLANGIFLHKDFIVKDKYLTLAKKYYNSVAQTLDFRAKSQEATEIINNWISNSTNGRIPKFYDEPLSTDTVAVLISALYFNAKWRETFDPQNTKTEKFSTGVTEIEVPTMNKNRLMDHSSDDTLHYDSVSLEYAGKGHEMTIYLPHTEHGDHGSLVDLFHSLAQQKFAPNTTVTRYRKVDLKVPKMKFSWKKSVVNALKLESIFKAPDLDELTSNNNLQISDMVQATELEVDEQGTIASATTAIELTLMSALIPDAVPPVKFYVNRPYLVTITHRRTRAILFAGVIRKPIK